MSRKKYFERDLVRINIRRQDYDGIVTIKRSGDEPMYSLIQRIWGAYKMDKSELEEELITAREYIQILIKRAVDAEKELDKFGDQRITSY